MSMLSDRSLADLYPHYRGAIGPASLDLALGDRLLIWPSWVRRDPRVDQADQWRVVDTETLPDREGEVWVLRPGCRYLAATHERVRIPDTMAGQIVGRSSWGRDGLAVIVGPAGFLDAGYHGNPTLELTVTGSELVVWPGATVAQLVLHELSTPADRPYGHPSRRSKYQLDRLPTPSRLWTEVKSAQASQ